MAAGSNRALALLGTAALVAAYAALKLAFGPLICDDAYITLAHARSWHSGLGPIMSAHNPVCATSTPLYTLLLTLESLVLRSGNYERLAYAGNVVWDAAGLFFMYRLGSGLGLSFPMRLLAVSAYALSVNFLAVSAFGINSALCIRP